MKLRLSNVVKALLILAALSLPIVGFAERWRIYDTWRLRDYTPSSEITQLATDTTMNDSTRRLFYVYHPDLEDRQTFNNHCKSAEKTIVLGCYVEGTGIYLYHVTDARLEGVLQVTAAHETLHAAYGRLNSKDKQHVDEMVNAAYDKVTDQRIRGTIDDYRKNGADTTNELHSILGTEVRDLPAALEQYYQRYFTNRKAIVGYSEQYEQAFTERKQKVAEDDKQLETIKQQIDSAESDLNVREQAINEERSRLEALLAAKDYTNYNAGVPGFNAQVSSYNAQVVKIRGLIDQYNALVEARNNLASEETDLIKAIDSRPDTLQKQ